MKKISKDSVLGSREIGSVIRNKITNELSIPGHTVTIDFGEDLTITQSFLDEAFWILLLDEWIDVINHRLRFINLSEKNRSLLKFVLAFRLKQQKLA